MRMSVQERHLDGATAKRSASEGRQSATRRGGTFRRKLTRGPTAVMSSVECLDCHGASTRRVGNLARALLVRA